MKCLCQLLAFILVKLFGLKINKHNYVTKLRLTKLDNHESIFRKKESISVNNEISTCLLPFSQFCLRPLYICFYIFLKRKTWTFKTF